MNPDLERLQPYPFERIRMLLSGVAAADKKLIKLSVGEPKHEPPAMVLQALAAALPRLAEYPPTQGSDDLRGAMASWLDSRYALQGNLDPTTQILPVNGTREALFAIAQCLLDRSAPGKLVLSPNPFYQIYEGAALLAGCELEFYDASAGAPSWNGIDASTWQQTQLIYVCNPGNPTGSTLSLQQWQTLIQRAMEYNFTIVADECYSEVYREAAGPPPGLLQAAVTMGNTALKHCLVFHSLSKRSNLPGLRSGFVAGDAELMRQFLLYRTYHGCSMAPPVQVASAVAWRDEEHVIANRTLYDEKYATVDRILGEKLGCEVPDAGFYLWPELPVDDETFTQDMRRLHNIDVVPGSYLSREIAGANPGSNHCRLALVATLDECIEAANRIRDYLEKG